MNLQNFRELLKPIGQRFWPQRKVHEAPAFFWTRSSATYAMLDEVGKEQLDEYVCRPWYIATMRDGGPLPPRQPIQRLPFDQFIVRIDDEDGDDPLWRLIVQPPQSLFPDDVSWGLIPEAPHLLAISTEVPGCTSFDVWDAGRRKISTDRMARIFTEALWAGLLERLRESDPNPKVDNELVCHWRQSQAIDLRPFLFELFHPANHVVKVSPPRDGRSVEWRESRSHYVVLDRKALEHVGPNSKKLSEAESAEVVQRAAHRRRAHTRRLKHPKWGSRIGALIDVKSAWVGPKEWEGPDGKTYVLLDRKPGL